MPNQNQIVKQERASKRDREIDYETDTTAMGSLSSETQNQKEEHWKNENNVHSTNYFS